MAVCVADAAAPVVALPAVVAALDPAALLRLEPRRVLVGRLPGRGGVDPGERVQGDNLALGAAFIRTAGDNGVELNLAYRF